MSSTLQTLLALDPVQALVSMLNLANNTSYRLDGFTVGKPTALSAIVTRVTLTGIPAQTPFDDERTVGSLILTYNRLDMGSYLQTVIAGYHPTLPTSTQNILNEISTRIGQKFYIDDMVLEEVTRDNGGLYRLKAKPGSLRWVGHIDLPLLTLSPLSALFNSTILNNVTDGSALTFSPNIHLPFVNGTDYRTLAESLNLGDLAQDRANFITLFNTVVPDPTQGVRAVNPWHTSNIPGPFNLYNATVVGLGNGLNVDPAIPTLENALVVLIDGVYTTNFANGLLSIPYTAIDFNTDGTTNKPRLIQGSSVSISNGSNFAVYLNALLADTVITSVPSNFLIDGTVAWIANIGLPSPTNLGGATILYNGQRRATDLPAATQGLDRVLEVLMTTDNSVWQGSYIFFYAGPIQMDIQTVKMTIGSTANTDFTPQVGAGPFTYAIVKGILPPDLTIDPNAGTLSGTATKVGDYVYTLAITDSNGVVCDFIVTHHIGAQIASLNLKGQLPPTTRGEPYVAFLDISGGLTPYSTSLAAGYLPPTLKLSITGSSVRIAGSWDVADTYHFAIGVSSADGQSTSLSFVYKVDP